jgi:hypothetical protein
MEIQLQGRNETRVKEALARRAELMNMRTAEMPGNWSDELSRVNTTIAAAVAVAASTGFAHRQIPQR